MIVWGELASLSLGCLSLIYPPGSGGVCITLYIMGSLNGFGGILHLEALILKMALSFRSDSWVAALSIGDVGVKS